MQLVSPMGRRALWWRRRESNPRPMPLQWASTSVVRDLIFVPKSPTNRILLGLSPEFHWVARGTSTQLAIFCVSSRNANGRASRLLGWD